MSSKNRETTIIIMPSKNLNITINQTKDKLSEKQIKDADNKIYLTFIALISF